MPQINTILVDDEIEALDSLEILLSAYEEIRVIHKIADPIDVFPVLMTKSIDLIFLDIKMPLLSGIDLLTKIRKCNPNVVVVIVTAFEDYSMEAIKLNVFNYLLKPIDRSMLKKTIEDLRNYFKARWVDIEQKLVISSKSNTVVVAPRNIVYCEAEGSYTFIYLNDGSKVVAASNIGVFKQKLCSELFMKLNRSVIVNTDFITLVNKKTKTCMLKYGGQEISLSVTQSFIRQFNLLFSHV
ncbi:MAG: hypothetical protein COB98_04965 [Flavobacteriaceae bacterium]|nr:MAG: hypothetical protein COB98_04965 [Flavobacteriaceae bacterium]